MLTEREKILKDLLDNTILTLDTGMKERAKVIKLFGLLQKIVEKVDNCITVSDDVYYNYKLRFESLVEKWEELKKEDINNEESTILSDKIVLLKNIKKKCIDRKIW